MRAHLLTAAATLTLAFGTTAAEQTYNLSLSGDQEVPGPGDSDGLGNGTLTINDATGEISWSINYFNIAEPSAMHIHGPDGSAGSAAGVFVGLGVAGSGTGTLAGSTTTSTANALAINTNPTDFYVNIHNADFGPGAIRGQVPEPGSAALLALAGMLVARRRRRA